jgi:hypothetical protein
MVTQDPFQKTSIIIQHIKNLGEKKTTFIDDLVPGFVKGLFFLSTFENIWMK